MAHMIGEHAFGEVVAYAVNGGAARRICYNLCSVRWTGDGKFLYLGLPVGGSVSANYKTFIVPLRHGESSPDLPPTGIKSESDLTRLNGVRVINDLARPGPDVFALCFRSLDGAPKYLYAFQSHNMGQDLAREVTPGPKNAWEIELFAPTATKCSDSRASSEYESAGRSSHHRAAPAPSAP